LRALPVQEAAATAPCRNKMKFSIIIPTLNEEENIGRCLKSIIKVQNCHIKNPFEIIIVDGASTDKTINIAEELVFGREPGRDFITNFKIIKSNFPNLPLQLNEGARNSTGETLIFLHADNTLPDKVFEKINNLFSGNLTKKNGEYIGGAFSIILDGKRFIYALGSFIGNLYSQITKIYFGDRMIFVKRTAFLKLGGFKNIPIMSDVDFSIRMKTIGKTTLLLGPTLTSSRGIAGDPFWKRAYLILWALHSYKKGLDPGIIKEKYYRGYSREK
jgi:glycosyltransferase involved in cell wall biosynthesis